MTSCLISSMNVELLVDGARDALEDPYLGVSRLVKPGDGAFSLIGGMLDIDTSGWGAAFAAPFGWALK